MNDLRGWLEAELNSEDQLPQPDLVAGAVRRGQRMVLLRQLAMTATVVAVAVVLGIVGLFAPWRATALPRPADPSLGPTLPATAATIAFVLEQDLPADVRLSGAYQYEKGPPAAAV